MSQRSDEFVQQWVSENVFNVPGLEDQRPEVARLSAKLILDAALKGIHANEIHETVGDLEDYLDDAYLNVHNPNEGGF